MKFLSFVCSLLVFSNAIIFIHSQAQFRCLTGIEATQFNDRLIKEHNKYRSCHGVPPLVANDTLMEDSLEWSKQQAIKDNMEHSPQRENGENIAFKSSSSGVYLLEWNPVESWYAEIKDYRGNFSKGTGHYTQVVWKTSQKVGCGVCSNLDSTKAFATCRYSPPGNIEGQYEENVLPRRPDCDGGNVENSTTSSGSPPSPATTSSTTEGTTTHPTPISTKSTSYTTWATPPTHSPTTPTHEPTYPTHSPTTPTHEPTYPPPDIDWNKEKVLIMITMSIHVILGLLAVIILSMVVYYFTSRYHRLQF